MISQGKREQEIKVFQVAATEEFSYTPLDKAMVIGTGKQCPRFSLQTPEKTLPRQLIQGTNIWFQWDISELEFLILHSSQRKPRQIILLANTSKDSRLGWKDCYTLRWEQRFNFPLSQYQIFLLYQDIDTLHKNVTSSSEKKHQVKTKLSLLL